MNIVPYLFFNGQARAAITAYADIFNVPLPEMIPMGDGPPGVDLSDDQATWVMHCAMEIGPQTIMMSDDFAGNSPAMQGCSMMLSLPTETEAKTIFNKLADGGEVSMAWEPTFWSAGFGSLTDRFGIRWMVDTNEPPKAP